MKLTDFYRKLDTLEQSLLLPAKICSALKSKSGKLCLSLKLSLKSELTRSKLPIIFEQIRNKIFDGSLFGGGVFHSITGNLNRLQYDKDVLMTIASNSLAHFLYITTTTLTDFEHVNPELTFRELFINLRSLDVNSSYEDIIHDSPKLTSIIDSGSIWYLLNGYEEYDV